MKNKGNQAMLARVKACLSDFADADNIFFYDTIDSTNNEAKRRALDGAKSGTVILAGMQTEGRGRMGRSFYSPKDSGIYCSILLRPRVPIEDAVLITVAASIAAGRAIFKEVGIYPQIKWVNDLYMDGKKVCGILAEAVSLPEWENPAVVVGVGINCTTAFPKELREIAGNIKIPQNAADLRERLTASLIGQLRKLEEMLLAKNFLEEYREHSMVIGKEVWLPGEGEKPYLVQDIGERGELILEDESGNLRTLASGEISIRLKGA